VGELLYPSFKGLPVLPSKAAFKELAKHAMTLEDAVEILECGLDCARSPRRVECVERCVQVGEKTLKVVAVKSVNYSLDSECWLLTHVGVF